MSCTARKLAQCPGWARAPPRTGFRGPAVETAARWAPRGCRCSGLYWRVRRVVRGPGLAGNFCARWGGTRGLRGCVGESTQRPRRTPSAVWAPAAGDHRPARTRTPVTFFFWNFLEGTAVWKGDGDGDPCLLHSFCWEGPRLGVPGRAAPAKAFRGGDIPVGVGGEGEAAPSRGRWASPPRCRRQELTNVRS